MRVFYLGAPSNVAPLDGATPGELLRRTGNNTGNLLITHAIQRQIKAETFSRDQSPGPKFISENFDHVIIGASNILFSGFDFGQWADLLESIDLPCTIFGVGAQAPDYGAQVEVPPGTQRLLKIVSERSVSVGARGAFSVSVLNDLGIKNVRVIGCPSMYWNCQPWISLRRRRRRLRSVALNGSANVVTHAVDLDCAKRVEVQLARLSQDRRYLYFLQNEQSLMEIAAGLHSDDNRDFLPSLMWDYGLTDITPAAFIEFVRGNTRTYFQIEQWHEAMKQFDFVVGSRFHGCLMAMLAGVPCFIFVHDSRTRELCELLKVPHLGVREAGIINIDALYASLELKPLKRAYRELYTNYLDFLEENSIEHRLSRSFLLIGLRQLLSRSRTVANPLSLGL